MTSMDESAADQEPTEDDLARDPDVQALRGRDAGFVIRVVVWVVVGAAAAIFVGRYLTADDIGAAAAGGFGTVTADH